MSFGTDEVKMGWRAQPTAQVVLDGVRVPADAMLGGADSEGRGFEIAMNGLNGGRLNIAACSLGGAQAAFDKAVAHVRDRQAFGRALIDEPTIRFTLADMATALETSRTLLWRAASALDADATDKVELCAMAKRYVTDACFEVADQALQLLGGYGYLREYGLEKIVRDLRVHRILEGTNEIMRLVIGRAVATHARAAAERLSMTGSKSTVAFLGLGNMGGPMAANLVAAGHAVHGFDPVAALRASAEAKGAEMFCSGLAAVADADVVITSLPSGAVVKDCYAEVLPIAKAGALFIDTSTISVEDAREIHRRAVEQGMAQLDAPVSGGIKGAAAGTLAFMLGGEETVVEQAKPILAPMAGKIIHCGGSGAGQAAKLCNNMVLAVQQIAVGEAFVLAEELGLSAQSLFDVITGATAELLGSAHKLSRPGARAHIAGQQRLCAGLHDRADAQGPRTGDGCGGVNRLGSALGQARCRNLRGVRRRERRQGLQRCHHNVAQELIESLDRRRRRGGAWAGPRSFGASERRP